MKYFSILMIVFLSQFSFAQQAGPTLECMQFVLPEVIHRNVAAQLCSSGATVECMQFVLPEAIHRDVAAQVCKAGTTVECMKYVLPSVGFHRIEAARACEVQ